jgi:hypothetical protein
MSGFRKNRAQELGAPTHEVVNFKCFSNCQLQQIFNVFIFGGMDQGSQLVMYLLFMYWVLII